MAFDRYQINQINQINQIDQVDSQRTQSMCNLSEVAGSSLPELTHVFFWDLAIDPLNPYSPLGHLNIEYQYIKCTNSFIQESINVS